VVKTTSPDLLRHDLGFQVAHVTLAPDTGPAGSQVDVLVVDDYHGTRTSFGSILRSAGYTVDEAENGFVALEKLRSLSVGSVLLEVELPGLYGLQLLDTLDNPPPVILMSTSDYGTDLMLRRSKFHMFIHKPIPPTFLLAAVSQTIEAGCKRA
jgi:CheY-like chemotaxis protein